MEGWKYKKMTISKEKLFKGLDSKPSFPYKSHLKNVNRGNLGELVKPHVYHDLDFAKLAFEDSDPQLNGDGGKLEGTATTLTFAFIHEKPTIREVVSKRKKEVLAANPDQKAKEVPQTQADLARLIHLILIEELKKPFASIGKVFEQVLYALPKPIYKIFSLIAILGAIQLACDLFTPQPKEPLPTDTPAGETTGLPSETEESSNDNNTAEAPTETPTLTPEEQKIQDIALKIGTDVEASFNANPITRQMNIDGNLPPEIKALCKVFGTKLDQGRPGQGSYIDVFSEENTFSVGFVDDNPYCYVTLADGTIIVDAENDDGFLYLTPAIASKALGVEVARVSADGRYGSIGDAYDAKGRRVGGVSRLTMQWETVNKDGILPSEADPSSVPPTPVNPEQSNLYQVNYGPAIDEEAQVQAMANLAIAYENGDVTDEEIDKMSFDKRKKFSIALNEYRNELSGTHYVTRTDESGKKLYLGPDGKFHPEPRAVETRRAIVFDDEGFMHVFDNGEWIKIAGSQNIQFDDFENFPWPDTEIIDPQWVSERNKHLLGLTNPEFSFKSKDDGGSRSMMPIIILSKELGEMDIIGFGNTGTLNVYFLNENDRYSTNKASLIGNMPLFGDDLAARSSGKLIESSPFWQELEENSLYYLMIYDDQKAIIAKNYPDSGGAEITSPYSGFAPTDLTHKIITGQTSSKEMILIQGKMLIKAGQ